MGKSVIYLKKRCLNKVHRTDAPHDCSPVYCFELSRDAAEFSKFVKWLLSNTVSAIIVAVEFCVIEELYSGTSNDRTFYINLYELLRDDHIPHDSWKTVIQYLKGLGYQDARLNVLVMTT